MVVERDHHTFDVRDLLGHPGRAGLPEGYSIGLKLASALDMPLLMPS